MPRFTHYPRLARTMLLLLLIAGQFGAVVSAPDDPECLAEPGVGSVLNFTYGKPADIAFICPGGYVSFHCCMNGFQRIEWYEFVRFAGEWQRFHTNENRRVLRENNQTVKIFSTSRIDATNYSCVGYGVDGRVIRNNLTLNYLNCDRKTDSRYLWPQDNKTEQLVPLGSNYKLQCLVQFGNQQCNLGCDIYWYKTQKTLAPGFDVEEISQNSSERIWYRENISENGLGIATLYLHNIQKDDLIWTYACAATKVNQDDRTLQLTEKPPDPKPSPDKTPVIILIAVGVFIGICLVLTAFAVRYNVELQVLWKTKVRRPKQATDKQHDVFLLYDPEEDREFAENVLYTYLEDELKLGVRTHRMSDYGRVVGYGYSTAIDSSSVMVVVVTSALYRNGDCRTCIQEAISSNDRTIPMIYITRVGDADIDIPDSERELERKISVYPKITWGDDDDDPSGKYSCRRKNTVDLSKRKLHLKLIKMLEVDEGKTQGCFRLKTNTHERLVQSASLEHEVEA